MNSEYRVERWSYSHQPEPSTLRQILESEGYGVFEWSDPPGATYAPHRHSENQSHWILSGALELVIENVGTFILEAGDRDFMPVGTLHSARVVGEKPVTYLIGAKIK